jgi:aminoglycoside phosphotransferase (APT) family kinase protein
MSGYQEALERGCVAVGLNAAGARLLRLGSNVVYRLKAPVVARISRPGADAGHVRRTVAVSRWLEPVGYPAVRVVHVDQPLDVDGYLVTFWQAISDDGDECASTPEVAQVLARLHHLTAPEGLNLPPLEPFANAAQRIAASTWLSPDDRSFLASTLAGLQDAYGDLDFALPPGVIHGDASVGNVLRDTHGNPVLIDLDGVATGPRKWDLVLTALYYDSLPIELCRGIPRKRPYYVTTNSSRGLRHAF